MIVHINCDGYSIITVFDWKTPKPQQLASADAIECNELIWKMIQR